MASRQHSETRIVKRSFLIIHHAELLRAAEDGALTRARPNLCRHFVEIACCDCSPEVSLR